MKKNKKNNVIVKLFPVENGNLALAIDETKTAGRIEGSGKKEGTVSTVEPIRNLETLKRIRAFFIEECNKSNNMNKKLAALRNHLLFTVGINTALRISDLLKLTWKELLNGDKFIIQEKKTKKFNTKYINSDIENAIEIYIEALNHYGIQYRLDDLVFNITKQNFIKTLKRVASKCGFKDNIGTHTMRKTFSYWFLMNNKNNDRALQLLSDILNHSSEQVTRRYAGISEDEKKDVFEDMSNFYQKVDKGDFRIYDDKITVSKGQVEELIQYAYTLGKENSNVNLDTDLDNLDTIKSLLEENILT